MIEQLRIRNLGVIREAVVDFSPGLTVLTGETGAGKTMVFRSLSTLFGTKVDTALVAAGTEQAIVEADVIAPAELKPWLEQRGVADPEDDVLILSRQVNASGRSRAFISGLSMPAAVMAECGEQLVAIHGQSEQLRLTKPDNQRDLLDRFAGGAVQSVLSEYRSLWQTHRELVARIEALTGDSVARLAELEYLNRIFEQVDTLQPQPGEDIALHDEAQRLAHTEALRLAVEMARGNLDGDEDGLSLTRAVSAARKSLESQQQHDSALEEFASRLGEVQILIGELSSDLTHYLADIDASPERLEYVESRRAALKTLTREFGGVDELLAWVQENALRREQLQGGDESIAQLQLQRDNLWQQLETLAAQLSTERTKAAERFASQVSEELDSLAMAGARVEFRLESAALGPFGADVVALGLMSRPNAPWVPIAKGASGGELSRIMLAVQVVLATADPIGTFVFDEIDAGVGGQAAVEVGKRLATLARTSQVIVVTHLAQVAAFADQHLVVTRADDDSVHSSQIAVVAQQDRVVELSRMLAGLSDSQAGEQLAQDLLAIGQQHRLATQ